MSDYSALQRLVMTTVLLVQMSWGAIANLAEERSDRVIDVGNRKQLFVDETFIASSRGVQLTMNPPYQTGELLIPTVKPYEQGGKRIKGNWYSSILKEGDLIRVWYHVIGRDSQGLAYAESRDGIHFIKPEFGLIEIDGSRANNVVIRTSSLQGGCVWLDPNAPASHRYRTLAKQNKPYGFPMYSSPDGVHWKLTRMAKIGGAIDTQSVAFWDENHECYVLYTRQWTRSKNRQASYRQVRRLESTDLIRWGNGQVVMEADVTDLATYKTPTGMPPVDYYGACVFPYDEAERIYVMLAQAFWHWKPLPDARSVKRLGPAAMDVRLCISRDGVHFRRIGDRRPFLRLGPEGRFDSRIVWAMPRPIRMGDELWIYYVGGNMDHDHVVDPAAPGGRHLSGIARAVMRLDGFVSADAGYKGGEIITPMISFEGKTLELNLDTSGGGSVLVELLDNHSKPIAGFTCAEATPLCGNSVCMPVFWGENRDLSRLAGKPIKLRFIMRDCKLYAFQFKDHLDTQ